MTSAALLNEAQSRVASDVVLQVEQLCVRFNAPDGSVHAVNGISLDVKEGETLAIVGESSSGKSVSMLSVMGLLTSRNPVHTVGDQIGGGIAAPSRRGAARGALGRRRNAFQGGIPDAARRTDDYPH